ncbi:hypothetical protein JTB14_001808 [Gonioctena quinquepunctata]|nr:hypothetical protein JTB14_001808 [Gonioctena quinquepunctata]
MNVEFRLEIANSNELIEFPVTGVISSFSSSSEVTITDKAADEKHDEADDNSENLTFKTRQPKKVHLKEGYCRDNFSVCSNGTALKIGETVFVPFCFKCHEICKSLIEYQTSYYYGHNRKFNLICYYCSQVYKNPNVEYQTFSSNSILEYKLYSEIQYLCSWNCGKSFDSHEVDNHEKKCSHQPEQICPVTNCYVGAKLEDVANHFHIHNNRTQLSGTQNWTYLVTNGLKQLTGRISGIVLEPLFNLTNKFTELEDYVWVSNILLKIKITWLKKSEIEVEISTCAGEGSSDGLPAKALVFNGYAYTFVGEGTKCRIILPSEANPSVTVKCYLEH